MNRSNFKMLVNSEPTNIPFAESHQRRLMIEEVLCDRYKIPWGANYFEALEARIDAHWREFDQILLIEANSTLAANISDIFTTTLDCNVCTIMQFYKLDQLAAEVLGAEVTAAKNRPNNRRQHKDCPREIHWRNMCGRLALVSNFCPADVDEAIPVNAARLIKILTAAGIHCIGYSPHRRKIQEMERAGALACIQQTAGTAYRDTFEAIESALSIVYAQTHHR